MSLYLFTELCPYVSFLPDNKLQGDGGGICFPHYSWYLVQYLSHIKYESINTLKTFKSTRISGQNVLQSKIVLAITCDVV